MVGMVGIGSGCEVVSVSLFDIIGRPFRFLCDVGIDTFLVNKPSHVSDLIVDEKTVLTDKGESKHIKK